MSDPVKLQARINELGEFLAARDEEIRRLNGIIDEKAAVRDNAVESANVRGVALERAEAEVDRLRAVVGDLVDERKQAEAKLAENSLRGPWLEIAAFPTVYEGGKCHESVMRAYHVAAEIRRLLELGTPPAVVLQVMDLLEQRGRT